MNPRMRQLRLNGVRHTAENNTNPLPVMGVGLGLLAAVGAGAADLIGHGRLPWPDGALQNPDVLIHTIIFLLGVLAYMVMHRVFQFAAVNDTSRDEL
jgi:hypothetical protein